MNGFVIGKFCPPHLGHDHLIQVALRAVDALTIVVCSKSDQVIPVSLRVHWLREEYPTATIKVLDQDSFDDTLESSWVEATKQCLGTVPEYMFTSEAYGDHYAHLLGCKHTLVDHERMNVPISATKILANPTEYQGFLIPAAREYFLGH